MTPTRKYSLDALVTAVEREIAQRQRVYPRLVRDGKMTQAAADRQIDMMRAVRAELKALQKREQPPLIDEEDKLD